MSIAAVRGSRRFSIPDLSALAPAADTPTLSWATSTAAAAPNVAGSSGWYREKRSGVAEAAAGGAQSSTNDLDLTGSTHFSYPAQPAAVPGVTANAGNYVNTGFVPGSNGSVQNARWLFAVSTVTSADIVEYRLRAPVANPFIGQIIVNGKRVSEAVTFTTGISAGGAWILRLTFPSSALRTITIYGLNNNEGGFGGMAVNSAYSLTKPTAIITRRVAIIGDSFVRGSGNSSQTPQGANPVETFLWKLAKRMGADEIVQAGLGGTGWLNQLSTGTDSLFSGRITPVMSLSPHVVIFAGGRNDTATGLQAAVESSLDAVGSTVERYVTHTAANAGGGGSGGASAIAAIAAACKVKGVPFVDTDIDGLTKLADGIHPTFSAHQTLAANVASGLIKAGVVG